MWVVCLLGFFLLAVPVSAEFGFDEKYERNYNIFNPINQYRPDNPLNPINAYDPKNPFNRSIRGRKWCQEPIFYHSWGKAKGSGVLSWI